MTRIIFDSNNIGHMAAYAFGDLTYKDRYIGVVYGFLNQMLKMARNSRPRNLFFVGIVVIITGNGSIQNIKQIGIRIDPLRSLEKIVSCSISLHN